MVASLRSRLILTFGGLTLVAVVAFALLVAGTLERLLLDRLSQDLQGQASVVARLVAADIEDERHEEVEQALVTVDQTIAARVLIVDQRGNLIGASEPEQRDLFSAMESQSGLRGALNGQENRGVLPKRGPESEVLYVALPIRSEDAIVGAVRLSYQLQDIEQTISQLYVGIILGALVTAVIASIVAAWFASAITTPVRALSVAAQRLAEGDLAQHVTSTSRDEIGRLVGTFNGMAERLSELETARREFASDISHELNSLAGAMQAAATALEQGADKDPALRHRLVDGLVAHTGRLGRLADDLLELARLESGRLPLTLETTSLRAVASQVVAEWSAEAAARKVQLELIAGEDGPVHADHNRLVQACGNLVENALKYTPDGGQVTLKVGSGAAINVLEVRDDGQGIAEADIPYIFHRFYRVEGRASAGPGGTGLGLAIVDRIVQSHGGSITVTSAPGHGSTFVIRLPRLREEQAAEPGLGTLIRTG
jgi:signal transduction histidine kinase/outer membrane murein-binding lipoprotein Lpp